VNAVNYAVEHNVLLVVAAGNDFGGPVWYPAAIPGAMAVSATTPANTLANFSSTGPTISISAPGFEVLSTVPAECEEFCDPSGYGAYYGTSMAAPYVAGVAALIWSVNPQLTAGEVRQIIEQSADDLGPKGRDDKFGFGRLNAGRAVTMAVDTVGREEIFYIPYATR
jgi:subtilisin family serine protease